MKPLSVDVAEARFRCLEVAAERRTPSLAEDVERGFAARPRSLPPKYFYDAAGSALFEAICRTREYYPSRAEAGLLERYADAIVEAAAPAHILEFGSGSSRKTRYLLDACERRDRHVQYWPFDVCEAMLFEAGGGLIQRYPWLRVNALRGDYLAGLAHLPRFRGAVLYAFLGGTVGNFAPAASRAFIREIAKLMRPGDCLLLGADRVKAPELIEAAYNDAEGVTARFNLNLLNVLNRELGADFDTTGFEHRAFYNRTARQIEMYLLSRRDQKVRVPALNRNYPFARGEAMLTEISRKFDAEALEALVSEAGLRIRRHFEGGEQLFSLVLAER